jgi:hypothetical protein
MKFPTDNLYKFLGIFGVLLFLGSGVLYYKTSENVVRFFDESKRYVREISESQKSFVENTSKLTEAAEKIATGDLNQGVKDANKLKFEISRNMADYQALQGLTMGKMSYMMERDLIVTNGLVGISLVGLIMAFFGIWGWYRKLQCHIDKKVEKGEFTLSITSSEMEMKTE